MAKRSTRMKRKGSGGARKTATRGARKGSQKGARKTARAAASRGAKKATSGRKSKRPASQAGKRKTAARAAAARGAKRKAPARPSAITAAATRLRGAAASAVVSIRERLPWGHDENDPILLLEADHRRFEALLKQGEETTERAVKGRTELLDSLTALLNVHELVEEKLLYPALESHPEARDIVLEGYQEHHVADILAKELHRLAKDNEQWGPKWKVLKESLEHHIEEEEGEMFKTARAVLSREELDDLGARMKALRAGHAT